MIQKLIINADDFGMTQGVNIGIILAHQQGIVTSTTCMMNMSYAKQALTLAKEYPHLGVGVHLILTVGRPLIEGAKSFTDETGAFKKITEYPQGQPHPDQQELYREWKAQIEKYISITGHKPTHLDSHHHVHLMPGLHEVAIQLATEYHIPMRQTDDISHIQPYVPCEIHFHKEQANFDYFKKCLESHQGTLEIMCHPALLDQRLYEMSSYHLPRIQELDLLSSQAVKDLIKNNHIQLINYKDIIKVA